MSSHRSGVVWHQVSKCHRLSGGCTDTMDSVLRGAGGQPATLAQICPQTEEACKPHFLDVSLLKLKRGKPKKEVGCGTGQLVKGRVPPGAVTEKTAGASQLWRKSEARWPGSSQNRSAGVPPVGGSDRKCHWGQGSSRSLERSRSSQNWCGSHTQCPQGRQHPTREDPDCWVTLPKQPHSGLRPP